MDLEGIRQSLTDLGITQEVLLAIGGMSLFVFLISVRFVMKWYLGIQHVHDELRLLRKQIEELRFELSRQAMKVETPAAPAAEAAAQYVPQKSPETFRLTH